MPRVARCKSNTNVYHIMLRGINKQLIFEDVEDKRRFLETLLKYKNVSGFELFAYCLMDNHVHLLIKETKEPISNAVKRISSSYVYWYNMKYERSGHLFQERFKSEKVENQGYFIKVLRYIHQNPVKAGLANTVFECQWTSINEYIHEAEMVDVDYVFNIFSLNRKMAVQLFIEYVQKTNQDQCLDDKVKERLSDREVTSLFLELGIRNASQLQQMDKQTRDAALTRLKKVNGVSVRQLSRVTGISKSVIQRCGSRDLSL